MIKGIAASAGVSVSKVFKLQHPEFVIERRDAIVEEELAKLHNAIANLQQQVEKERRSSSS